MAKIQVKTKINGEETEFLCQPYDTVLDVLRRDLNMTGTKEVCSTGDCGACSITMDGRLVCSCLVLANTKQEHTSLPSIVMLHAPQSPVLQTSLVPVMFKSLLSTSRTVSYGWHKNSVSSPFIFVLTCILAISLSSFCSFNCFF